MPVFAHLPHQIGASIGAPFFITSDSLLPSIKEGLETCPPSLNSGSQHTLHSDPLPRLECFLLGWRKTGRQSQALRQRRASWHWRRLIGPSPEFWDNSSPGSFPCPEPGLLSAPAASASQSTSLVQVHLSRRVGRVTRDYSS